MGEKTRERISLTPKFEPKPSHIGSPPSPYTPPYKDKETADKVLDEFIETTKSLGITYILVLGTCLGFFGIGGYIDGDNDLDIGVICNEKGLEELTDKLKIRGFIYLEDHSHNRCFVKNNIFVDVWYIFPDEVIPFLRVYQTIGYNGKHYNVPYPVEKYLELQYGDWVIPCPDERPGRYL